MQLNRSIREWFKKEGETVESGDALCEVDAGDVVYDFAAPVKGIIVRITARKGATDLKGGEVIGYMATSLDNVTSVRYESAKEIAEGRVQEHLGDDKPLTPPSEPSGGANGAPASSSSSSSVPGAATTSSTNGESGEDAVLKKWLREVSQNDDEFVKEYADKFKREGFTSLESLATLDEDDLNAMDITKRGHRKVILQAAQELAKVAKQKSVAPSAS